MQLIQVLRTCRVVGSGEVNGMSDSQAPMASLVVVTTSAVGLLKPVAPSKLALAETAVSGCGRDASRSLECAMPRSSNGSAISCGDSPWRRGKRSSAGRGARGRIFTCFLEAEPKESGEAESSITRDGEPSSHDGSASVSGGFR